MTSAALLVPTPFVHALGWTLIHSLWQGVVVAITLAGVLQVIRRHGPNIRYAAACSALLLMLVLPAVTLWQLSNSPHYPAVDERTFESPKARVIEKLSADSTPLGARSLNAPADSYLDSVPRHFLTQYLEGLMPWLTAAWFLGVLLLTLRVAGGVIITQRLIRCHTHDLASPWSERVREISKRLRLSNPVRLLESGVVQVPTTIGWLRPLILLPCSTLTGLTPKQLDLILAHELAHIRRHDYLVNLLQMMVETLLFYHPAIWWISRQLRNERELACDDMAVSVCGDPVAYARALAKIERLRQDTPLLALAADGGILSHRILRLVNASPHYRQVSPVVGAVMAVVAILTSIVTVQSALSNSRQPAPTTLTGLESIEPVVMADSNIGQSVQQLIASDDTSGEDLNVRQIALASLCNRDGTVIIMNPQTGFVHTIVNQDWAVRRSWKPASVIKLVTAAAALGTKAIEPAQPVRFSPRLRPINLEEALALSSNSFFSFVGKSVGPERIISYARELGLGEQTGINYPSESAGFLPAFSGIDVSRFGATGEGVEATPIQLATLVSAIANGGMLLTPHVPRSPSDRTADPHVRRRVAIPRENLEYLIAGMIAAVDHGTANGASNPLQIVAGKTGTFLDKTGNVGIFASYAPADNPRFAVVVVTRGKNESGPAAATIAGTIYRALIDRS